MNPRLLEPLLRSPPSMTTDRANRSRRNAIVRAIVEPSRVAGAGFPAGAAVWRRALGGLALLCAVVTFTARLVAAEASDAPFTPAKDLAGSWSFVADPALPNVLLLGDSISIGYTRPVRALLKGRANVYRASNADGSKPANCGDTRIGLAGLERWLGNRRWSVIHFNWGLWDLCYRNPASKNQGNRDKAGGKLPFSIEEYEKNLETIVTRLEATGAVLIWASTTTVPENEAGRFVGDEDTYNRVAARVMARHHIAIDDLHALTRTFSTAEFIRPGDVHYTEAGYARLARKIAEAIAAVLPKDAAAQAVSSPAPGRSR